MKTNILQTMADKHLFASWFEDHETWAAWRTFLAALFALPIENEELYSRCTGGRPLPTRQAREAYIIVGRRGGKSFIAALTAVFMACFRSYKLSKGETGVVMLLATDKEQAKVSLRYVRAFLTEVPMLRTMVENVTALAVELSNGLSIEIHTSSYRSVRGRTIVACVCDEAAFWRSDESANPDREVLNALRPSMATVPNALLLVISTPYSRTGVIWDAHRRYFGKPGDVLVWQADTKTMNPSVPQAVIDDAYEEDPASAAAEYGATFRSDLEAYISQEAIDACTIPGRFELPPVPGVRYIAFCDPSGGAGTDAMTLAIGHHDGERAVLDLVRERKPNFSPESVTREFAETLKAYGIHEVHGDKYAGSWPSEQFQKHIIHYRASEKTKSELYQGMLPLLNSGRVELLNSKVLRQQLIGLERRTARGGKDSIDHRPGGRDDVVNAAAGALIRCVAVVPITADMFAQGTFSYFGRPDQGGRNLWDQ